MTLAVRARARMAPALALFLSFLSFLIACASAPLPPDVDARVQRAIAHDLSAYPELAGRAFALSSLEEADVFFQSNFAVEALDPLTLSYAMQINPRAFALGLDDDMLRGVIGHELAHTLDYERRTARGAGALAALLPRAALPESNTWERWTDLIAVDRGFGAGLLRYRVWQFGVLDDDAVARKKRVYYGPAELAALLHVRARCPALFRSFLDAPPVDLRAIATHCP